MFGLGDTVLGGTETAGGLVSATINYAIGDEAGGNVSMGVSVVGGTTFVDGLGEIATAFDGEERQPALEKIGAELLGGPGQGIARAINTFGTVSGMERALKNAIKGTAAGKDFFDAAKFANDNGPKNESDDPCKCK